MSATKLELQHHKYHYTSEDFKWPRLWHWTKDGQREQELSKVQGISLLKLLNLVSELISYSL